MLQKVEKGLLRLNICLIKAKITNKLVHNHILFFVFPQHMTGAHKDWVSALDFLRSQNVLLSGCRGGMLKLWRVENGALVCK